jgi:hypothetical protein
MQQWLIFQVTNGGALLIHDFVGTLAELHVARGPSCSAPLVYALSFSSEDTKNAFGCAFLASTARFTRRALANSHHYVAETHNSRYKVFIRDSAMLGREAGLTNTALFPSQKRLLDTALELLCAMAPTSCRPKSRHEFLHAQAIPVVAAHVAAAAGAAAAVPPPPLHHIDDDATTQQDSEATELETENDD